MPLSTTQIARSMMQAQRNKLALPTLAASLLLLALFALAIGGYLMSYIPLWAASLLSFFAIHMSFAVAHEATHKTISNRSNAWLDQLLGTLHGWLLVYDFPTFKFLHLRHHANTNDPEHDPDYWLQNVSIPKGLFLGLFVPLHYLRMFVIADKKHAISKTFATSSYIRIGLIIAVLMILLIMFPVQTFFLWLAPASIASSAIAVSHRILHTIEQTSDRKKTTLIVRGERFWEYIVSPFFWLNNHHFLHHEYPKLPCYTHESLFAQTQNQLKKDGVQVRTIGAHTTPSAK
ncbi:fatty acid desaturase family protein [Maritalea porphyrae]|uniref:fatty acid desaturase family protein n=1 Tax=Maritalea porphyrae TaxID=880732 RepID=UPI0022AF5DAA|nr:fatty acid desaturase [Maritalea porphyrae]MCZ4273768.1 fatty acid desaturase [Maritalea porphyrae]